MLDRSFARRLGCSLAVALLAGCTQGTPAPATHRSGTRLRARVQILDDGARRLVGWHDRELGIDCSFGRDAAGVLRCLPVAARVPAFADPACTVPAHLPVSCEAEGTRWVRGIRTRDEACWPAPWTFDVWELDPARATTGYSMSESCAPAIPDVDAIPILPASPSIFVEATIVERPVTPRLTATYFVTADGAEARRPDLFRDVELDRTCRFVHAGAALYCVPPSGSTTSGDYHGVPDCSDRVAYVSATRGCEEPLIVEHTIEETCGGRIELRELGPRITGPLYAETPEGTCVDATWDPELGAFHELGPLTAEGRLVRGIEETRGTGGARFRTITVDGVPVHDVAHALVDAHGATCFPLDFEDGRTRCVSHLPGAVPVMFADPECRELLVTSGATHCGAPPAPLHFARLGAASPVPGCASRFASVHRLEPAAPGPRYQSIGGVCTEIPDDDAIERRMGEEIDLGVFPEIREEIE